VKFYGFAYLIFILLSPTLLRAQEVKPSESVELLSWKSVESVELSPDGGQVIFTTKEPDWKQNRFSKSIWVMAAD